jgi:type IV secretion system protein VirD4
MVSRQETARPLLTPGEVMQLPPADELVLVSGLAPIRAKKLRYFQDRNFTARVSSAPRLADDGYLDRPPVRRDDWSGQIRSTHVGLAAALDREFGAIESSDEGGLQQQRHPGVPEPDSTRPVPPDRDIDLGLSDDGGDPASDKQSLDRARQAGAIGRAHAMNEGERKGRGADDDLLPAF